MKRVLLGAILAVFAVVVPIQAMAAVDIHLSVNVPPPIEFAARPQLVVIPGTYVYVVPDLDVDIFFYDGWWWRPWEGRWYRSRHYDTGWGYYRTVPSFYSEIPADWREEYRGHTWNGLQWNYQPIPERSLRYNWSRWQRVRHWERDHAWYVQGWEHREGKPQPRETRGTGRGAERGRR